MTWQKFLGGIWGGKSDCRGGTGHSCHPFKTVHDIKWISVTFTVCLASSSLFVFPQTVFELQWKYSNKKRDFGTKKTVTLKDIFCCIWLSSVDLVGQTESQRAETC